MSDTTFVDFQAPLISAAWLNALNALRYKNTVSGGAGLLPFDPALAYAAGTAGYSMPWVVYRSTGGDDTAGLQAAMNTAGSLGLPLLISGYCRANNLSSSAARMTIIGLGAASVEKNANGPLLTLTGNDANVQGVLWRGNSATHASNFTGDNVVFTGNNCRFQGGSRWAHGRAVKATGDGFRLYHDLDIIQTTDTSGTGYDIEVGNASTATLYHEIEGYKSTQATGGILLVETGSAHIRGGQFGKLTISSPGALAGTNGGTYTGCRVLGAVSIGSSGATFDCVQFAAVAITFETGTSGCSMGLSNTFTPGHTIVNNGNANNLIMRQIATGSGVEIKVGPDVSDNSIFFGVGAGSQTTIRNELVFENNKALRFKDSGGTTRGALLMSAGGIMQFQASGAVPIQITTAAGQVVQVGDGAWNGTPIRWGGSVHTWIDASTRLRVKSSAPTSDTDGTVVGTQT